MNVKLPEINNCPKCGSGVELTETEGRLRPVCPSCGYIVYINPIPAAAVVVIDNGRLLLTLRSVEPKMGEWCLPGGFVEWGESPEDGAKRELFEETGVIGDGLSLLGAWDSVSGETTHVIVIVYLAQTWSGEIVPGDDAADVRWFDLESVPKLAFSVHEKALAVARGKAPF